MIRYRYLNGRAGAIPTLHPQMSSVTLLMKIEWDAITVGIARIVTPYLVGQGPFVLELLSNLVYGLNSSGGPV